MNGAKRETDICDIGTDCLGILAGRDLGQLGVVVDERRVANVGTSRKGDCRAGKGFSGL